MTETHTPHPDEISNEAERLRRGHAEWSGTLEDTEDVNQRAQELRDQIAQSGNPEKDFSYQDRVFANGEIEQSRMLSYVKLHHNANMWEAQEHYRQNKDAYFDLAKQASEAAGVQIHTSENEPEKTKETQGKDADALFLDPSVISISLRRHGAYERSQESVKRGQLTKETMPDVKTAAHEWAALLPDGVQLDFVTSPTGMPTTGPTGNRLMPARARMTGALYGGALRERFGEDFTRLAQSERSEKTHDLPAGEVTAPRTTDQRLGDIFEFTTKEKSEHIPGFFKELSSAYGGMTPEFWHDYIRGNLPEAVQKAFLAGGGDTALDKSIMATDWIIEHSQSRGDGEKHVALAISHEEVIGSLTYQIAEYLRKNKELSTEEVEAIESEKIGYNQGFDLHVDTDGKATIKIGKASAAVDLQDFREFLKARQEQVG